MQGLGENLAKHGAVFGFHEKGFVRRLVDLIEDPESFRNELQIVRLCS